MVVSNHANRDLHFGSRFLLLNAIEEFRDDGPDSAEADGWGEDAIVVNEGS